MIKIIRLVTLIALVLLLIPTSEAASNEQGHIIKKLSEQFLKSHSSEEQFTALAVSVIGPKNEKVSIYAGQKGFQNGRRIKSNSLFQMGSLTKSFISALVIELASDPHKHLSLDDHIDRFFPAFKKWHEITIRNLLNMTSGIPDYFSDRKILTEYANAAYQVVNTRDWVNRIYNKPLLFLPGTRFHYSNTNYLILGMLIEKITGNDLSAELKKYFFKPLNMTHTYYVPKRTPQFLNSDLVHGYQYQQAFSYYIPNKTDVTHFSLSCLGSAGAIISNPKDMVIWLQDLFLKKTVLTPNAYHQFFSMISQKTGKAVSSVSETNPSAYALGVGVHYSKQYHTYFYTYEGVTLGYRAMYAVYPEKHILVFVTVNSNYQGKTNHLWDLIQKIVALEL